jgi:hypothetical protein
MIEVAVIVISPASIVAEAVMRLYSCDTANFTRDGADGAGNLG